MKVVKQIILILLVPLTITGCYYNNEENPNPIEKQKEQEPAINEEKVKEKEPINISTEKGIALTGMIKKENNEWYFADPTYELTYQNGNYYTYFGINLEKRLNNGEYDKNNIFVGTYSNKKVTEFANFNKILPVS